MQLETPPLNEGEIYAGAIIQPDGTGHHFILLPGQVEDVTWKKATEWAAEKGGDLPSRPEQSLLYAHLKSEFDERYYWSNTQHASYSVYAWYQDFAYGLQHYDYEYYDFRARAVRRVIINSVI